MKNRRKALSILLSLGLLGGLDACRGSSDDDGDSGSNVTTQTSIEGTLSAENASSSRLGAGEGGISGVTVSALGDSDITDEFGNFTLFANGTLFLGGPVEFTLRGSGIDTSAVFDDVAGGPGTIALVDMMVDEDGQVSGESRNSTGTVLSEIISGGRLGCTQTATFVDGGYGALWKPVAESTGTAVILMPPEYRLADVEVLDANGQLVASPLRRSCCNHNGNREHIYLTRSASSFARESLPL
ncbi:MAG: hypothetical protein KDD44_08655, partial [Bdellovibrionales bacterium]|nr:hypothetical protein [Bdellovibrionales bacterium]